MNYAISPSPHIPNSTIGVTIEAFRPTRGMVDPCTLNWSEHNRGLVPATMEYLWKQWDPELLEPIDLNIRPDGTKVPMRGQHRGLTARRRKEEGLEAPDYTIEARLHYFKTPEEEAAFIEAAERAAGRGKWKTHDYWKKELVTSPSARALDRKVRGLGFEIVGATTTENRRQLKCISTLKKLEAKGGHLLDNTLCLIRDAWLDEPCSNEATIILGVAMFIYTHAGAAAWSIDKATERMREAGISKVKQRARELKRVNPSEAGCICEAMCDVYNTFNGKGCRKLYPTDRTWSGKRRRKP